MAIENQTADCPQCGFPISGYVGESKSCPNCSISGTITGVEIPTTLFWSAIAFAAGVILSPYLRKQLAKQAGG